MVHNVKHITGPCGCEQCTVEPTLFKKTVIIDGIVCILLLLVWVDDVWAAFTRGGRERILMPFAKVYKEKYPIKFLGPIKRFVGIDITRNRDAGTITLSQKEYIKAFVPKFVPAAKLEQAKRLRQPARILDKAERKDSYSSLKLASTKSEITPHPYLSALASALYASVMTRVDVCFNNSYLSRFSSGPTDECWEALVEELIYLYQTADRGLTYGGASIKTPSIPTAKPPLNPSNIRAVSGFLIFSDASWKVGSTYAGGLVLYCNAAVDWYSKLLKVQCSSAEAEIGSGSHAGKRSVYVREFRGFIEPMSRVAISHLVDNSAMPPLTENAGVSKRSEHFRRWQHFLRYLVTHGYTYIHLCRTHEMHANALTKVENLYAFEAFVKVAMNL